MSCQQYEIFIQIQHQLYITYSYWPLHLLQEDVVVVTLNYRLGAFGFLVLPEAGIWGNAGLKDQVGFCFQTKYHIHIHTCTQ